MKMLNQLGALVLIFLATACQASSSENQGQNTSNSAVVSEQVADITTEKTAENSVAEESNEALSSPTSTAEEKETTTQVVKSQVPKAKAVVYQPETTAEEEEITPPIKHPVEEAVATETTEVEPSENMEPTAPEASPLAPTKEVTPEETKEVVVVVAAPSH
ncbi:MAG: hypothetical protein F6K19_33555, partial [Cyanothece sp. SIO1E1]|nr:hypothetical protein [Cyanothece sp. SIO1E1]